MAAEQQRLVLMAQVAQLYYEQGATQEHIASQLKLSRPTVSRLLKEAREEGIVQITVRSPLAYVPELEGALVRAFPALRRAVVAAGGAGLSAALVRRNLGRVAAEYIQAHVRDGDLVGVTWGHTMEEVSARLQPRPRQGVTVVQLNGGVSRVGEGSNAGVVVHRFGRAFAAVAHHLPVPAVLASPDLAAALRSDRHTAGLLELGRRANVAIFSVGDPDEGNALVQAGYFSPAEMERLRRLGAVGDICSRFFTATGAPADPELEARTIGLELAALREKELSVAVAGGPRKVAALRGALAAGYANVLITDEATARRLLETGGP